MQITLATKDQDDAIKVLAKQSPFTKDFCSIIFVRQNIDQYYERGEIGVAMDRGKILGFVCVHHLIRRPYSSIYYMGTSGTCQRKGVGRKLVEWALKQSPHHCLRLVCEDKNMGGIAFYKAIGFREIGRGASRGGHPFCRLELQ